MHCEYPSQKPLKRGSVPLTDCSFPYTVQQHTPAHSAIQSASISGAHRFPERTERAGAHSASRHEGRAPQQRKQGASGTQGGQARSASATPPKAGRASQWHKKGANSRQSGQARRASATEGELKSRRTHEPRPQCQNPLQCALSANPSHSHSHSIFQFHSPQVRSGQFNSVCHAHMLVGYSNTDESDTNPDPAALVSQCDSLSPVHDRWVSRHQSHTLADWQNSVTEDSHLTPTGGTDMTHWQPAENFCYERGEDSRA